MSPEVKTDQPWLAEIQFPISTPFGYTALVLRKGSSLLELAGAWGRTD
jgi:hypothetical protein